MYNDQKLVSFIRNLIRPIIKECIRDEFSHLRVVKPDKHEKEILNVSEASEILGVSVSTMYSYTHRNLIPFYKKGKKLWFKRMEIESWINSGKNITQEEFNENANRKVNLKSRKKNEEQNEFIRA